ncbi:Protein sof1 [Spiromyces aspiralis]|uniref:Protein sof1 n=1 Tax=Spiromyces aspiralis TaxID=68401 RepID=A0ACC1HD92_9FUNG|nr:Protein sof1 [Spiromyces aspiralis]
MFAKPFLGAMNGHIDGVYTLSKHPWNLDSIISGSGDGEIRIWSLGRQECVWRTPNAHRGMVQGVCPVRGKTTDHFISVGSDKLVKVWSEKESGLTADGHPEAIATYTAKDPLTGVDHHRTKQQFATSSSCVEIWDVNRSQPLTTMEWGADTVNTVRMNQTETNVLASCGTDRTVILYDLRTDSPIVKVVMALRTNAISWNPMEAFIFAAVSIANEDHNCYIFDMRRMNHAANILKGHVSAVMDVDYSPTGEELVTASYDRSIRLWKAREGHSRDIYHTKRMQRVFCARFSMDDKYVVSGSDDGNVRLWKARASERLGPVSTRERNALEYSEKLRERYQHLPEVRKIIKNRNVPQAIKKAANTKWTMIQSQKRKEENRRKHSKSDSVPHVSERTKSILKVTSK